MKFKINLTTNTDILNLVSKATEIEDKITLTDNNGMVVNAKSLLGASYAKFEFVEIWLESEHDHYLAFKDFMAEE